MNKEKFHARTNLIAIVFIAVLINFSSSAQQFNADSPSGEQDYYIGAEFNNLNLPNIDQNFWHGGISFSWLLSERNLLTAGAGSSLFTGADNYIRNLYLVFNHRLIRSGIFSFYLTLGMTYNYVKNTEINPLRTQLIEEQDEYSYMGVRPGLGVEFALFNGIILVTEFNYNMTFKTSIDHTTFGAGLKYGLNF